MVRRFERTIRAVKLILVVGSIGGLLAAGAYVAPYVVDVMRRRG